MAIETLFGPSLADVQELRRRQAEQEIQGAGQQFGVFAPLYQAGLRFGNQAVQGVNTLLGAQDPMLKKATDLQTVLGQYQDQDITSSDVLKRISSDLASKGYAAESFTVAREAQQAATRELALRKATSEERKAELSERQELALRQELAALGPEATETQVLGVVSKYGSPDKILTALSSSQARRTQIAAQQQMQQERLDAQRELQQQRLEDRKIAQQERLDTQRDLQQQRIEIQQQSLNLRRDMQDTKLAEKDEKKQAAAEGAISNASRVIQTVGEAKQLVGVTTTGGVGGLLSMLPQTDARKLRNKIDTIKANLGFDRLQQMRDASPTGGALGQVAVQEINFLQSTVATLDQLESVSDITNALNKIEEHYRNWKTALEGKLPSQYQQGGGSAAVPRPTTGAPVVAPSGPVALPPGVTVKRKAD